MKREELLTDAMLFFSPNERSITAENGARYYREDVVLKAMELAGKETPLPPAEGAEIDDMMFTIYEDGINPLNEQPTAEGAEEYLRKHPFLLGETEDGEDYLSTEDIELIKQLAPMLEEFATLHAQRLAEKMVEEKAVGFADWLSKLQPSQKVSVWSKNGEHSGLFTMDNEQLYKKYLKSIEP